MVSSWASPTTYLTQHIVQHLCLKPWDKLLESLLFVSKISLKPLDEFCSNYPKLINFLIQHILNGCQRKWPTQTKNNYPSNFTNTNVVADDNKSHIQSSNRSCKMLQYLMKLSIMIFQGLPKIATTLSLVITRWPWFKTDIKGGEGYAVDQGVLVLSFSLFSPCISALILSSGSLQTWFVSHTSTELSLSTSALKLSRHDKNTLHRCWKQTQHSEWHVDQQRLTLAERHYPSEWSEK